MGAANLASKTSYQGTTNLISNNAQVGNPQQCLAANFAESAIYTVAFSIGDSTVLPVPTPSYGPPDPTIVQPKGGSLGCRATANCVFTVEGAPLARQLDIGSGSQISICCQGVNVAIFDNTFSVSGPNNVQYSVTATCTKGVRSSGPQNVPSLFYGTVSVPPLGPVNVTVPQNIGVSSVAMTVFDSTVAATVPDFLRARLKLGAFDTQVWAPALTQGDWIKVTPGTTTLELLNFSATDTVSVCVLWGIDG